jgi:4-hydroxybenzoate polyprenyltransferase
LKALRLHQWLKNILLFVPLLAAHQVGSFSLIGIGLLAFLFFGLCASSVYLLNDLVDLEDDRHHITKKHRQFAAGNITISSGLLAIILLLFLTFSGSLICLPCKFVMALLVYYFMTVSYSLFFKRIMMLDVVILASLYTIRIIAGTFAFNMQLTFWMLGFSMFIFTSLALVKRYAELKQLMSNNRWQKTHGRGYFANDLDIIGSLGAASGYLSVLVLALYIQDSATISLYRKPQLIWFACPLLLFWISRTWLLTHRGLMHEDPVIYAIKDRISLITGGIFLMIFWLAT